jgi:hypothetical protein
MTTREKATELITKFTFNTRCFSESLGWEDSLYDAKQCAIISIVELLNDDWYISSIEDLILRKKYWNQVIQEIKNM